VPGQETRWNGSRDLTGVALKHQHVQPTGQINDAPQTRCEGFQNASITPARAPRTCDLDISTVLISRAFAKWSQPGSNRRPPACKEEPGLTGEASDSLDLQGVRRLSRSRLLSGDYGELAAIWAADSGCCPLGCIGHPGSPSTGRQCCRHANCTAIPTCRVPSRRTGHTAA
jgi:hypothetical protein